MSSQQDPRWSRLEEVLTVIKPGEMITVNGLVIQTGLGPNAVESVLNGLTKAELFVRKEGDVFVRRSLLQTCAPVRGELSKVPLRLPADATRRTSRSPLSRSGIAV